MNIWRNNRIAVLVAPGLGKAQEELLTPLKPSIGAASTPPSDLREA